MHDNRAFVWVNPEVLGDTLYLEATTTETFEIGDAVPVFDILKSVRYAPPHEPTSTQNPQEHEQGHTVLPTWPL